MSSEGPWRDFRPTWDRGWMMESVELPAGGHC